jgi:hypothetical protein
VLAARGYSKRENVASYCWKFHGLAHHHATKKRSQLLLAIVKIDAKLCVAPNIDAVF